MGTFPAFRPFGTIHELFSPIGFLYTLFDDDHNDDDDPPFQHSDGSKVKIQKGHKVGMQKGGGEGKGGKRCFVDYY